MDTKKVEFMVTPTPVVLRQFSAAALVVLVVMGLLQWLGRGHAGVGQLLCGIGIVLGVGGLIWPRSVKWVFLAAMVVAWPIGWAVSQVVLAIMFYLIITPLALFFRWRGRDLLARKPAPGRPTFWMTKTTPSDLRSYFRQF